MSMFKNISLDFYSLYAILSMRMIKNEYVMNYKEGLIWQRFWRFQN